MANAFTGGGTGQAWDLLTETAYDRAIEWYLRDEPQWRQVIDKRPGYQAMPGDIVTLTILNELGLATSPLTETVDPDAVAAPTPTRVQVTLQEWGNTALSTLRLQGTSFAVPKPQEDLATQLGLNQIDSIDAVIRSVADAGTNILWMNSAAPTTSGSNGSVGATDLLLRTPATIAPKILARNKVRPKVGPYYAALIHPDVSFDLQAENSATAWTAPHIYGTDTQAVYTGAVGDFQRARYVETTRVNITADGGSSRKVYSTYYLGQQALVEASVEEPHVVVGPQTDKLKRFFPIGWYALAGWAIYRPKSLMTVRTTSTISTL